MARAELKEKLDSVEGKVRAPNGCCSSKAENNPLMQLCALVVAWNAWACLRLDCSATCSCRLLRSTRDRALLF